MRDPSLQQEFWAALGSENLAKVRDLIAAGADLNIPIHNPGGETPLIRAINDRNRSMIKLLVEMGADVNLPWKGPKSWTPLMFAHDDPEILQLLIDNGANVDAKASSDWIRAPSGSLIKRPGGQTALHLSSLGGNAEAVKTLLRAGATIDGKAEDGCAPLDYAVRQGAITEAAEALVEAGAQLTPERLEAMHAAAHDPNLDLVNFIVPMETRGQWQGQAIKQKHTSDNTPPSDKNIHADLRCPNCYSLIYSRKPKICGQCGAFLPAELLLTDFQAEALADQRRAARALADKFDQLHGGGQPSPLPLSQKHAAPGKSPVSVENLLRSVSCVEEFRGRARPTFALYVVGYGGILFVLIFLGMKFDLFQPEIIFLATAVFLLLCFRAWMCDSPVCPNCKIDITLCSVSYCHVCGGPLRNGRCEDCLVNISQTNVFGRYLNSGNFRWITFCPGCGVRLNAKLTRWRLGR